MSVEIGAIRAALQRALTAEPERLDLVALAIARLDDEPFDDEEVLATLERWADSVQAASMRQPDGALDALTTMLGGKLGLCGDEDQYDDPENSYLPRVIERRMGLPILLSIVYIEVGRRAGISLFGLALPGHFVVGHHPGNESLVVVDPFAGGNVLSLDDIEAKVVGAGATLSPEMLAPASAYSIATRMLRNLLGSYQRRSLWDKARAAATLMQAIDPSEDELN